MTHYNPKDLFDTVEALPNVQPGPIGKEDLQKLNVELRAVKPDILNLFHKETKYTLKDCELLWEAVEQFVDGLPTLVELHSNHGKFETRQVAGLALGTSIQHAPLGKVLICLPSNAPIPLAFIVPLALAIGGNSVIVAASGASRLTSLALAAVAANILGERIILWGGGVRDAVNVLLGLGECPSMNHPLIDALYFMGSSAYYSELAANCARSGVTLLYEGEGRGIAIVDDTLNSASLGRSIDLLFTSKTFCYGKMCSAPNVFLVHESVFQAFRFHYLQRCMEFQLPTPIKALASSTVWQYITGLSGITTAKPFCDEHLRHPFIMEGATLDDALKCELFCPGAFLIPFDDFEVVCQDCSLLRYRLQISLFSDSKSRLQKLIANTRFARYCRGMCPTYQHPLLPWGNYGLSGNSDVLDFYAKGLRRVIVEDAYPAL